jgi:hypothetical protein
MTKEPDNQKYIGAARERAALVVSGLEAETGLAPEN